MTFQGGKVRPTYDLILTLRDDPPRGRGKEPAEKADRIQPGDRLHIHATGGLPDLPIKGVFRVEPRGKVALGPVYGRVMVKGLTLEEAEAEIQKHLARMVKNTAVCVTLYDPASGVGERPLEERVRQLEKEVRDLRSAVEDLRRKQRR